MIDLLDLIACAYYIVNGANFAMAMENTGGEIGVCNRYHDIVRI